MCFSKSTIVCAFFLAAIFSAFGQESINFASVSGRVSDPSGAIVQGATVTAKQIDTNLVSTASTDADGRFRFPYLKTGLFEIRVRQQGFSDAVRTLTLTVGAAFDLPIVLGLGAAETNVVVDSQTAFLETARSQPGRTRFKAQPRGQR